MSEIIKKCADKITQEELKIWVAITKCEKDIEASARALKLETDRVEERCKNKTFIWLGGWSIFIAIIDIIAMFFIASKWGR